MAEVRRDRNPGFVFLELLMLSILITTASRYSLWLYAVVFILLSLFHKRSIFQSFRKSPFLVFLVVLTAISHAISSESLETGTLEGFRYFLLLAFSLLFIEVVDSAELSSALGSMLERIIGRKAWVLSSSIMVTLALLPIILQSGKDMYQARESRAASFIKHPIRALSDYSVSLLKHILRKSEDFYEALLSRGYRADQKRHAPSVSSSDIIFTSLAVILCVAAIAKRSSGN